MLLLLPARRLRFFAPRLAFRAVVLALPTLRFDTLRAAFLPARLVVAFFFPAFLELFFRVAMG